jgi:hypothetical protein
MCHKCLHGYSDEDNALPQNGDQISCCCSIISQKNEILSYAAAKYLIAHSYFAVIE